MNSVCVEQQPTVPLASTEMGDERMKNAYNDPQHGKKDIAENLPLAHCSTDRMADTVSLVGRLLAHLWTERLNENY